MYLFKKQLLFLFLLFTQAAIQSASFFKDAKGYARITEDFDNTHDQKEFEKVDYSTIKREDLFIVIGPNDSHAKLAFFEQKPNGKYQVKFFKLETPNISAEFSTEKEAQYFLYDFMTKEPVVTRRHFYAPKRPGYDWRKVPSSNRRR